jgi:hypothetical protein
MWEKRELSLRDRDLAAYEVFDPQVFCRFGQEMPRKLRFRTAAVDFRAFGSPFPTSDMLLDLSGVPRPAQTPPGPSAKTCW